MGHIYSLQLFFLAKLLIVQLFLPHQLRLKLYFYHHPLNMIIKKEMKILKKNSSENKRLKIKKMNF